MTKYPDINFHLEIDGLRAELLDDLFVEKYSLTIPKGFITDFASVPRFFWRIIPPWGRYSPAAVVHDYLYRNKILQRKTADGIFYKLMILSGVPKAQAATMYWAVRAFGWTSYGKKK
jgi:hypothetical protein